MNFLPPKTFLSLSRQRSLLRHRPWLRIFLLAAGILAIIAWQGSFKAAGDQLDSRYSIIDTFGGQQSQFAYFYHHLGLYPLSVLGDPRPGPTKKDALRAFNERGPELRLGQAHDQLTIISYLPDIYLGGDIYKPSHNTAAWFGFIFALIALYAAFWSANLEIFGLIVVALVGSDPFQLHEVYVRDNIFGWVVTIGLLVTAINIPLIVNHRYALINGKGLLSRYLWAAPVLSGLVLGTFRHLRTECLTAMVAVLFSYLFLSGLSWRGKGSLAALLLASFLIVNSGWDGYFQGLNEESRQAVEANGGQVRDNRSGKNVHPFWHPIWGGLGDFDGKYGYLFWDRVAADYAEPIIATLPDQNPDIHILWKDSYAETLKSKVLKDIVRDPLWYAEIIVKRLHRVVMENTPPRLSLGGRWLDIPGLSLLLAPFGALALICYLARREWSMPLLLMFPFSIGGVAIAVSSLQGFHYYGLLHLFLYALMAAWCVEALFWLAGLAKAEPAAA